jgi:precorrin-6B methylase 2
MTGVEVLYVVFMSFLLGGVASLLVYERIAGAPPIPTMPHVRRKIMAALAGMDESPAHIAELGCGWGGLIAELAKLYPDARIVGYELSPLPYWVSKLRTRSNPDIDIIRADFLSEKADLRVADMVLCYLYPAQMGAVKEKLERELKTGAIVMSNACYIESWEAFLEIDIKPEVELKAYFYRV